MSAAVLDLETISESTQVDVPVVGRRVRGRLTSVDATVAEELEQPAEPASEPDADAPSLAAAPKAGRLSELYLRTVEDRRASSRRAKAPAFEPGCPQLLFARVDDPGLRLRKRSHGFELSGHASPIPGRHDRRLAIAFDGELFAVLIQPSESIEQILDRLGDRLRGRFELLAERSGPRSFLVSFAECLPVSA